MDFWVQEYCLIKKDWVSAKSFRKGVCGGQGVNMKVSDMNEKQKKAFYNIKHAANDLLGGLENTLLDYSEDSEEYKSAKALLDDHDELVKELYRYATSAVYSDGAVWFGKSAEMFIRDINFCGKDWLMERCERRITKEGY